MSQDRLERQITAVLFLFCLCILFQNISTHHLLGFSGAEVYGHAWTHWWRFQDFPNQFLGMQEALGVEYFPPIDIVPLFFSACFAVITTLSFGYNMWIVISVILAGIGGYMLAKSEEGEPWVGAFVLAFSPVLLGSIQSGLTEDMAIGFSAIAISMFRKTSIWGVVFLVLSAYSGLVLGWMTGLFVAVIAIVDIRRNPKNTIRWLCFGALTICCISPLLWLHFDRLQSIGHRFGSHVLKSDPFWVVNPWKQIDLASFFVAGRIDFSAEIIRVHPAYLGLFLIPIALCARSAFWWMVMIFCSFASMGEMFRYMGVGTSILNPVRFVLELIPGYYLVNHHGRFLLVVAMAWSVLVSKGARRIRHRVSTPLLCALIAGDLALLSPIGFVLPKTDSYVDTILDKLELEEGQNILRLPMMGPSVSFQEALWEQCFHGKRLLLSPNRPGIQSFARKTKQSVWIETFSFPGSEIPTDFCIPSNVDSILVDNQWSNVLEQKIGAPDQKGQEYSFWRLSSKQEYFCP